MTDHHRRFDPSELRDPGESVDEAEVAQAYAAARFVETTIGGADPVAARDLADRIMVAIARERAPRTAGILAALRRRPGLTGLADSLRIAWRRALSGGSPIRARAMGFAYLAAVLVLGASLSGVAAFGAAGAWHLISPDGTPRPDASQVLGSPLPLGSPEASQPAEPGETAEPSESAEPGETPSLRPGQTEGSDGEHGTASPTSTSGDDHGGDTPSPTSTSGDEHGGTGATATPTATPQDTPRPTTGTPKPTSSN
ncbi:MAG TPA: hypothetical protein VNH13_07235 [Candidatus Acidoferrales bacterium]|nr:hypothetical protein [Candidatus Acidoferrales bacterium]